MQEFTVVRMVVLAAALMTASGCATAFRGTREVVLIESEPAGADVHVTNGMRCTTPCALELSRRHGYGLEFLKSGYRKQAVALRSAVTPGGAAGMASNITLIGIPVDAFSGGMRSLAPNPVHVVLVAADPAE